jgi:thioredoxin 1
MVVWIITPIESRVLHIFCQNVTIFAVMNLIYIGELMVIIHDENNHEEKKMTEEPIHVDDNSFEKTVLQSELPVIVDFWAPWCGPCLMVGPILETIAKDYAGKLIVAKVNTDENPKWAMEFGVQGIPTMLLVANGNVVHQQVGAIPEPFLKEMVDTFLETTGSD